MVKEVVGCLQCKVRLAKVRGLCNMHYQQCLYLIQIGQASWQELEKLGKCLPSKARKKARI